MFHYFYVCECQCGWLCEGVWLILVLNRAGWGSDLVVWISKKGGKLCFALLVIFWKQSCFVDCVCLPWVTKLKEDSTLVEWTEFVSGDILQLSNFVVFLKMKKLTTQQWSGEDNVEKSSRQWSWQMKVGKIMKNLCSNYFSMIHLET